MQTQLGVQSVLALRPGRELHGVQAQLRERLVRWRLCCCARAFYTPLRASHFGPQVIGYPTGGDNTSVTRWAAIATVGPLKPSPGRQSRCVIHSSRPGSWTISCITKCCPTISSSATPPPVAWCRVSR
jgi:hypothetical protein